MVRLSRFLLLNGDKVTDWSYSALFIWFVLAATLWQAPLFQLASELYKELQLER
jgi:hypothetical protein